MPVDGTIQLAYQDTAWFNDPLNAEIILKEGQHVYLSDGADEFLSAYVVGDGVTELQDLPWKGLTTGVQTVTGQNVDNTDPVNPVVNVPTWDETLTDDNTTTKSPIITDATLTLNQSLGNQNVDIQYDYIKVQDGLPTPLLEANTTTGQLQKRGVDIATVNDIPSLSGYVDTAGLTTNTIPKATASDTIGDSSIEDNGTLVTLNNDVKLNGTQKRIYTPNSSSFFKALDNTVGYEFNGSTNSAEISSTDTENTFYHDAQNTFNAPANNFPQLTPSQIVETDASKNLVSVAKATGYNLALGTTAGTVLEGNRITQTITNGVTDKVPSEDAVFDALALKLTQNNFTDITGSCTIVGWVSYTTNSIRAVDMGDYYIVTGYIVGTSNNTTTTVQMPYTNNGHRQCYSGYGVSNGTSVFTRVLINGASDTIDFRTGAAGNAWAATGTKEITFNLIIEK